MAQGNDFILHILHDDGTEDMMGAHYEEYPRDSELLSLMKTVDDGTDPTIAMVEVDYADGRHVCSRYGKTRDQLTGRPRA